MPPMMLKFMFKAIFCIVFIVDPTKSQICPTKYQGPSCDENVPCPINTLCTKVDSLPQCCDFSFCEETLMTSIPVVDGQFVSYIATASHKSSSQWYSKMVNVKDQMVETVCPIPYSFQFHHLRISPVGFSQGSTGIAKGCSSHADCSDGEFCGTTYNPSYCGQNGETDQFSNNCLDKSNNGTSKTFCYEADQIVSQHAVLQRGPKADFLGCSSDADCKADDLFCIKKENQQVVNGTLVSHTGLCAIINGCSAALEPRGKKAENGGQCGEAKCEEGWACTPTGTVNICCMTVATLSEKEATWSDCLDEISEGSYGLLAFVVVDLLVIAFCAIFCKCEKKSEVKKREAEAIRKRAIAHANLVQATRVVEGKRVERRRLRGLRCPNPGQHVARPGRLYGNRQEMVDEELD